MGSLVYWVVHLTAFTAALRLHGTGSAGLVIRIVVLQVHCVSAHSGLGLVRLHMAIELLILLTLRRRYVVLLMISASWQLPD